MVRLVVVLAGTLMVLATAALLKAKGRRPARTVPRSGLSPGIYLFSSGDCGECASARARLDRLVGPDGYREVVWETNPGEFDRLRIAEVPSTLVVAVDGSAEWHLGVPSRVTNPGNP